MFKSTFYFISFLILTFSLFATESTFIKLPEPQDGVQFVSKSDNGIIYIRDNGISLVAKRLIKEGKYENNSATIPNTYELHRIDLDFLNKSENSSFFTPQLSHTNDYIINDSKRDELLSSEEVIIKNVYDGIDFKAYYNENNEFQFDFIVNAGADPNQISLASKFQKDINLLEDKSINIDYKFTTANLQKPYTYQEFNSQKSEIKSEFSLKDNIISFNIGKYDKSKPLIIDPITRIMGSYFGGNGNDTGYDIEEDSQGNYYIAGYTESPTQIAVGGYQVIFGGLEDAYLVKFDKNNKRIWSTYFGDIGYEVGYALHIDNSGNIILVGETNSTSKISTPTAHQLVYGGGVSDGFIAKFQPNGQLLWATYYGGQEEDKLNDVTTDSFGNIYVVGLTASDDNIFYNGYQQVRGGNYDAFIVKFNPLGAREWGTYYGGDEDDYGNGITIDPDRNIYIVGSTKSQNNIAYKANVPSFQGNVDAFVSSFENDGTLRWGTYYGGNGEDNGISIASDSQYLYFAGSTKSQNGIAFNGYQINNKGGWDGFLVKYDFLQNQYWGTYYGGLNDDYLSKVITNNSAIYVAGNVNSLNNINLQGWQQTFGGGLSDGALAKYFPSGILDWSTYYGGTNRDVLRSVSNLNKLYVCGFTNSNNNINQNGFQANLSGQLDAMFGEMSESKLELKIDNSMYCADKQYTLSIDFQNISFAPDNKFEVELSDEQGKFDKPIAVGQITASSPTDIDINLPALTYYSKNYKLRLKSTNPVFNGISTKDSITIYPVPNIINSSAPICVNLVTTFSALQMPNVNYSWQFEDGIIVHSSPNSNDVRWEKPGTYKIVLIAENPICQDTTEKTVQVNPLPEALFNGAKAVCGNSIEEYKITNKSDLDYKWDVTNGTLISKTDDGDALINWDNIDSTGEVILMATDTLTKCMDTKILEVKISKKPVALITGADTTCKGCIENYTAENDNVSEWTVTNGTPVNQSNTEFSVKAALDADSMIVQLIKINVNSDCTDTNIKVVYLTNSPITSITGKKFVCEYEEYEYLTATNPDLTNIWSVVGGEIVNQSLNKVLVKWQKSGVGNLKLVQKSKDNSYNDSAQVDITINPKPTTYDYSIPSIVCLGDTTLLAFNLAVGESVAISIDGKTYTNNEKYIFKDFGTKNVSFTISNQFECQLKGSFDIEVKELPLAPNITQKGETITSNKTGTHRWYRDGKIIDGETNNSLHLSDDGLYTAQYYLDGCWSELSNSINYTKSDVRYTNNFNINVYPNPAKDKLIIQSSYLITNLKIVDLLGKTLFEENNLFKKEFDISKLNSGIYFVKIWVNDKLQTKKVIVN